MLRERLAAWLDVRPREVRPLLVSCAGAFLVIAFVVAARSLREALYLTRFPVETLPYITGAVAVGSVPAVAFFARLLARHDPRRVLNVTVAGMAAGVALLWPVVTAGPAVVVFYLWTALGTLLLTSGFWLVTAERFPVRGAKRLFGLIAAGGTLGAMAAGNGLAWLTSRLAVSGIVPGVALLLAGFLVVQALAPGFSPGDPGVEGTGDRGREEESGEGASMVEGLRLIRETPHLRTIALIVMAATIASTLVDYQFKELARESLTTGESLTGFFGAFYGWTGAAALVLQVGVAARLLSGAGIAVTLSVLPLLLLTGGAGLLIAPVLAVATAVRGGDNALRKSLHRSVLEVVYVPLPARVRRRTKTFVDSVADSAAEGIGAFLVFLWVTLGGMPSHHLSALVLVLAGALLWLARRMDRRYLSTVTEQLRAGGERGDAGTDHRDLLSASFSRVDLRPALEEVGVATATTDLTRVAARARRRLEADGASWPPGGTRGPGPAGEGGDGSGSAPSASSGVDLATRLASPEPAEVEAALGEVPLDDPHWAPALLRLLARDTLYRRVVRILRGMGEGVVPVLVEAARDEGTDFVIRRRVPRVLAAVGGLEADEALLDLLRARRFEVRYQAAIALVRRRRKGLPTVPEPEARVWDALREELGKGRPVWELQRLLDEETWSGDGLVADRVGTRGDLSLEHAFRLLSLLLEPEAVRAAFRGVTADDERFRSLALEYLEQVLPADVRERLWPFIGDLSERERRRRERPLDQVVAELVTTGATLFPSQADRDAVRRLLEEE